MTCPATKLGFNYCNNILNLSERLINDEGVLSFKYSKLMREHRVTPTVFYKYFSRKEDVLICLFLRTASSNDIIELLESEVSLSPRLRAILPVLLISEIMLTDNNFNKIRAIVSNASVWKVATDSRLKHFKDITNYFLNTNLELILNAIESSDFNAGVKDAEILSQMINRFIYGTITLAESEMVRSQNYLSCHDDIYSQVLKIYNSFNWVEKYTIDDLYFVREIIIDFLKTKRKVSCERCHNTYLKLTG